MILELPGITMLPCQYLWGSSECLLQGIGDYNNPKIGSIERSFNEFHRAWNALWMADVKVSIPLWDITSNKTHNQTNGIEDYVYAKLNDDTFSDEIFKEELLTSTFIEMRKPNTPIKANFQIIYKLRNIMEHDFVEFSGSLYGETVKFLNPYVNANLLNYINAYQNIYSKVISTCTNIHTANDKRKGLCVKNRLLRTSEIILSLSLPQSLQSTAPYQDAYKIDNNNKLTSRTKNLRNHLNYILKISSNNLSKQNLKHQEFIQVSPDQVVKDPVKLKTQVSENLEYILKSYKYASMSEVAKDLLGFPLKKKDDKNYEINKQLISSYHYMVRKIKEELIHELEEKYNNNWQEYADPYWKSFWDGEPRYSIAFYDYVANRIKISLP